MHTAPFQNHYIAGQQPAIWNLRGFTLLVSLLTGTVLSLFDIPIMHTFVDDLVKWLNRTFLNRQWEWPIRGFDAIEQEVNPPLHGTAPEKTGSGRSPTR